MKQLSCCTHPSQTKHQTDLAKVWEGFDGSKAELNVENLQNRIFSAYHEGKKHHGRHLQGLLLKSHSAQHYTIRHVTEVNEGRRTPGIDGLLYKTAKEKGQLLQWLTSVNLWRYNPRPVKRVSIKKNSGGTRHLGIPTIKDRCVQYLVKLVLEPQWEAIFHKNSFGFRPGRSTQDAVCKIEDEIRAGNGNYILNADITGFFDHVKHSVILENCPFLTSLIKKWLKAGICTPEGFKKTEKGIPQGGIISPLLANIALWQLEYAFNKVIKVNAKHAEKITLVRYADDFIILARSKAALGRVFPKLTKFLRSRGLQLNRQKTQLRKRTEGIEFLGFQIVHYKNKSVWTQPSVKSCRRFRQNIKSLLDTNKQIPTTELIKRLNRMTKGWGNYFRYSRIHKIFGSLDHQIFNMLWQWCKRRHPNKGRKWLKEHYFTQNWRLKGDGVQQVLLIDIKRRYYKWRIKWASPMNHYLKPYFRLKPLQS